MSEESLVGADAVLVFRVFITLYLLLAKNPLNNLCMCVCL